ncbi:hypothetical protein [Paenibacillus thiaminolyticus]|nr:hypothetical protein [Paenibacillus thiaminolyticus]MEC0064757.1 hypothetical protein [Paenibacillus thiaminolyticus]MEC0102130.1 hypothetical protein [Paenibacillus thiaminolyticus]SUA97726.1 Uncharacterised protein [Paenibacillus thiaminolyticus]
MNIAASSWASSDVTGQATLLNTITAIRGCGRRRKEAVKPLIPP